MTHYCDIHLYFETQFCVYVYVCVFMCPCDLLPSKLLGVQTSNVAQLITSCGKGQKAVCDVMMT